MNVRIAFFAFFLPFTASAQLVTPEVTSWKLNLPNETGYKGIPSNVQKVQYSADNVYVSCTCIPGYDIGPWAGNPNDAVNQDFTFKLTRHPQVNTGAKTVTPNGHIGVWTNGVSIFNAKDARSYNNQNVWFQNALVVEGLSFDDCLGHPAPNGEYHHHVNPTCLYDDADSTQHSPIIGYAFDGYPIYGAFAYQNTDGAGKITRMRTSYRPRNITQRTSLPDGTPLTANQYGPDVSLQSPLGTYIQDFEFVAELGDLDEYNGRYSITPEYPAGTYAYFVTIDATGYPEYPFTLGPTYYGIVPAGNTGPQSGHNVPTETVVTYDPTGGVEEADARTLSVYPNPATDIVLIGLPTVDDMPEVVIIRNVQGVVVGKTYYDHTNGEISVATLPSGVYTIESICRSGKKFFGKIVKQ
jgi:hypothetical protein